jgi:2-polyprenyl-3-methyl-5-hydroxy-6-metoxy-1,4-benzoquinol methylase
MGFDVYNPHEYWYEHGKTYKEQFRYNKNFELQESLVIDYLKRNLASSSSFSTVLEAGCGFGRITKLLLTNFPNIREYQAIDLSPDQIENAKEFTRSVTETMSDNPLNFAISDIQSFQSQRKYDLVIASEVLMHVLPSEIEKVMIKLVNMSNHHVINIDWYEREKPRKMAPHNFIHEYEKIYRNIPSVTDVYQIPIVYKGSWLRSVNTKQCIFHALTKISNR